MQKGKASLRSGATAGRRREDWASFRRRGQLTEAGLYSYHVLAGAGADTFQAQSASRGWRVAMLGTAAIGALWLMEPRPAQAGPGGCTTVGTTANCTGDQSAGIGAADFDQTAVDTLNVNSLTTNITPASGVGGISFNRGSGSITISSDILPHSITVTGIVDAIHVATDGVVTINHAGDISSAGGSGIYVSAVGGFFNSTDVSITSSGKITAYGDGIYAGTHAGFSGTIVITHSGDISSSTGNGILGQSYTQGVAVTNAGNINAANIGIWADGTLVPQSTASETLRRRPASLATPHLAT